MFCKLKKFFVSFVIISVIFLFSCTKSNENAFQLLKNLKGTWKSEGNIIVFDSWKIINDSTLKGKRFSLLNNDTVYINDFEIKYRNSDITLKIKDDEFKKVKAGIKKIEFKNKNSGYPDIIILSYPYDSVYTFRQENIRGNKAIEFIMKRIR